MALDKARGANGTADTGSSAHDSTVDLTRAAQHAAPRNVTAPSGPNVTRIQPSDGPLVLPATTSIDQIRAAGPDLVITLPDGQVYVIVNGAIDVPEIVVGNVRIPPANIAALLTGQEPAPAAGAPQSSGGNFAQDPGHLADAFKLGDLLDPTDLAFTQPERRELFLDQLTDNDVDVTITVGNQTVAVVAAAATVAESGLPARENGPAGSNSVANTESVIGTIRIDALDGPYTIFMGDTQILDVGDTVQTKYGEIEITSITATEIGYTYTLISNSTETAPSEVITITVTDRDGDIGTATLTITLDDDAPVARADEVSLDPADFDGLSGNVMTGAGNANGQLGMDIQGADGAEVTGVRAGSTGPMVGVGQEVAGTYGILVIDADGSYTYVRNPGTPGGVHDVFTYELTDGDGDKSSTTIDFFIENSAVSIGIPEDEVVAVSEAGLPAGSDAGSGRETTSGTIEFYAPDGLASLKINGQEIQTVGQVIQTATGRLEITAIGDGAIGYQFTLTSNTSGDFTGEEVNLEITDLDGDHVESSFIINIEDDEPVAVDDQDTVGGSDGTAATGNVIAGAEGGDGADQPGADGATVTGIAFNGAGGTVGTGIAGAFGTLVIHADGSYTYTLNPDSPAVRGLASGDTLSEAFTYTLTDGDGDTATATLTITVSGTGDNGITIDGLAGDGPDGIVAEAALPGGSAPDPDGLQASGSFTISAIDGVASVKVGGVSVFDGAPQAGAVINTGKGLLEIVSVTEEIGDGGRVIGLTIDYTYTLTTHAAHTGANGASLNDSFAIQVTDSDGTSLADSLVIAIKDDVPTARAQAPITVVEDEAPIGGNLLANDTTGADGAKLTSVLIDGVQVSVAAAGTTSHTNASGVYTFQANGAWTFAPALQSSAGGVNANFTYTITDGDGDTSSAAQAITITDGRNPTAGAPITLIVDEARLEDGSAPGATQPVQSQGTMAFTPGSDAIASIAFGDTSQLDSSLEWTRDSATSITGKLYGTTVITLTLSVTDNTATVTATLANNYQLHAEPDVDIAALGQVNVVATDTDGDAVQAKVTVGVWDDVPTITAGAIVPGALTVDESNLAQNASLDFGAMIDARYGADGPGEIVYELSAGNSSGLFDSATGTAVGLRYGENGSVIGYVLGSPSLVVFEVKISEQGVVTLDQQRAVRHSNTNNPDDSATVVQNSIQLSATIIDGDGDFANVTIDLSGVLVFRDDGPRLEISVVESAIPLLTTHDAATIGTASDVATASFAGAFSLGAAPYGADGPGTITWAYSLALGAGGTNSGLTSDGVAVTLAVVDGVVIGSAGGNPVFSIRVDAATGQVTLTQFAEIDHALPGSTGNYADQFAALANDLVILKGAATITDRDGDSASQSLTLDLGGKIHFADGGPTVSVTGAAPAIEVDETNMAVNAQANLSGLFAGLNYGPDGPGSVVYTLGATAGASGLIDSLSGEAVIVSLVGGVVYGRTETGGLEVFRITVSAGGVVTFDQSRSILHTPDTGPDQAVALSGTNLVTLTATVTDGDGDKASATADITGSFVIHDDAPRAVADIDTVARDGNNVADGNVLTGSGGVDLNETDGAADVLSADGNVRVVGVTFGTSGQGAVGSPIAGAHGSLTIDSHGFYRYALTADDPAVIALASGQTLTETFTYTIEDRDGDRSSATITITISGTNDLPLARADTNWVVDGPSGSDPTASGNVLFNAAHPGAPSGSFADVSDIDPDSDPLTVTNPDIYFGQYGTLVLAADGSYTYYLNEDSAAVNGLDTGQKLTDTFNYGITDGTLTGGSTLTITIFGTNDAPTISGATARVSEEGLSGGVPDNGPDGTLDTTNSTVATGSIGIADPDVGETLTVTLGDPGAVLTSGGQPVVWSGVGTSTLTGSVAGQPVITITVDNTGAYTVTLSRGIDHSGINVEDVKAFTIPVQVSDGTVTTTNAAGLTVAIEDDRPVATGEGGASSQPHQNVNSMFILDFSSSIDDGELNTMITAVKTALTQLDAATVHDLGIKFVIFSSGTITSPSFATAADANAWLAQFNPADGGVRPDSIGANTNYTAAIQAALAAFDPVAGSNNQIVFVSDGNPNQGVQFNVPPPGVANSLQTATANAWNTFVDGHNIGVTAIGINNDPLSPLNIQRLADIDLNDAPNNQPILIDNFEALMQTLIGVVVPPSLSGDLDANDLYGADGGRLLSITVGTTTYTWDGAGTITLSNGAHITGTTIDAATTHGGTLHLDFATGLYNYTPPSPITVTTTETFAYTLVDRDGDTASTTLSIGISTSTPPIALDLDGDGLEFVTADAGAHFDFDGDGVAETTAWVGKDDGLLAIDANGDGKVTDRSEIVFAQNGLTDLQGLAARYDTNHDGVLDAQDKDFAKFGVWQDANGNGVADAGEFTILAERGIVSLDLTGTGRSYRTADGQVLVHGETTYTRADGTTGKAADAAFATNVVQAQQERNAAAATAGTAMLAAGLIATTQAAAAQEDDHDRSAADRPAPVTSEPAPAAAVQPAEPQSDSHPGHVEPVTPATHHDEPPALAHAQHEDTEAPAAHADAEPAAHTFADLLAPAVDMDMLNLSADKGGQDAGFSAAPVAQGPAVDLPHPDAAVATIVTEALAEGDAGNAIDRLIDSLKQSMGETPAAPAEAHAALSQPLIDIPVEAWGAPDWSGAHQVLAEQHVAVQLDAAAAGHG